MIFEIKERSFHNEFFRDHASKKYETNNHKKRIASTFEVFFHKFFEDSSHRDFNFSNWSMKVHQKSKKFEIFIEFNQNLMIFEIKERNFHN